MKAFIKYSCLISILFTVTKAFTTFSIIAIDTETKEFGSAMATSIHLNQEFLKETEASIIPLKFIDSFSEYSIHGYSPQMGIIHMQGLVDNMYNVDMLEDSLKQMKNGQSANQILDKLLEVEIEDSLTNEKKKFKNERQFLILTHNKITGNIDKAAYSDSMLSVDYNSLTGKTSDSRYHYVIAGNRLTGIDVLNALENGFKETSGDLSQKLLGALLEVRKKNGFGDKDSINKYKTSSNFSFLKIYKNQDKIKNIVVYSVPNGTSTADAIDKLIEVNQFRVVADNNIDENTITFENKDYGKLKIATKTKNYGEENILAQGEKRTYLTSDIEIFSNESQPYILGSWMPLNLIFNHSRQISCAAEQDFRLGGKVTVTFSKGKCSVYYSNISTHD
ncbi:DUF1028 domain-containing protein [Fluviispira multicolorata]|uniref:DUF1028 domain-containing protein n=1 Tax=Fluviispira multicolorata TaxID=2654512 RepID=A0A833JFL3_9BACT|nr:DUF1028 domain-containing protein [Fluviispira multicolorata]KAB8030969.1 DUF1028 domain-containing protein [Fluviispira multicolorata]